MSHADFSTSSAAAPIASGSFGRDLAATLRSLRTPGRVALLACCALMLLACNVNALLGHRALIFKHFYPHAFMLACLLAAACKVRALDPEARRAIGTAALRALPWFLVFGCLVGVSALVSNGTSYEAMASNYWDTDPALSTSRRLGLPVLANVLGFEKNTYIGFWYIVLFAAFAMATRYLERRGLGALERLSLLSSSIFAYSLIGPGYNEIFVFLLGFYALQGRLGAAEKIVVATLMIATHETATPFVALVLVMQDDAEQRREWLAIFGLLYAAHIAAYVLTWRFNLLHALITAGRPSPDSTDNSVGLALQYPGQAILGVFIAYKLYWAVVGVAIARPETRAVGLAVLPSLILAIIGTDTSRLVEFGSLAFLVAMAATLPTLVPRTRTALAIANLIVPSLYVAINSQLLWGTGLYSAYLYAAEAVGLGWGQLFVQ